MAETVTLQMTLEQKTAGDASPERMVFSYRGHKTLRGGKTYLSYTAADQPHGQHASAPSETATMLTLSPEEIVMSQKGAAAAKMTFRPGETTSCRYVCGAGILPLEIRTKTALFDDTHILLEYALFHMGAPVSDNRLGIRLLPVQD